MTESRYEPDPAVQARELIRLVTSSGVGWSDQVPLMWELVRPEDWPKIAWEAIRLCAAVMNRCYDPDTITSILDNPHPEDNK